MYLYVTVSYFCLSPSTWMTGYKPCVLKALATIFSLSDLFDVFELIKLFCTLSQFKHEYLL